MAPSSRVVDSLGRVQGEQAHQFPTQGDELVLTIDNELQAIAEEALDGREGVIVALDPHTGEILALASYPTYDPNKFITRFTPAEWRDLINDPLSPLENRAIRGLYAPGSICKLVMSLGGLDSGLVSDEATVYCSGSTRIYGAIRYCSFAPGHGAMNLSDAIKNSCNIYFYQLGRSMGIEAIARSAGPLGLGRKTGIDLSGEKDGLVPSTEWKRTALAGGERLRQAGAAHVPRVSGQLTQLGGRFFFSSMFSKPITSSLSRALSLA